MIFWDVNSRFKINQGNSILILTEVVYEYYEKVRNIIKKISDYE